MMRFSPLRNIMKKGQITVFIILGIIILLIVGTVIYLTRTTVTEEVERARPRVQEQPTQVQPLRDLIETCIARLGKSGLRKIGSTGGYLDDRILITDPYAPTEGEAVQFSPNTGPNVAYWWHMKSPNSCQTDCVFDSKRPGLKRTDGGVNVEMQLDTYITENLPACIGEVDTYEQRGCTLEVLSRPQVTSTVTDEDVFFVADYPHRVTCEDQSFDTNEFTATLPVNLPSIFELATNLTNYQSQYAILEQATKTIIDTYSGVDSNKLPPFRAFEAGPPSAGTYWIKFTILDKLKSLLAAHIPLIQATGVQNYHYLAAPPGVRDPDLYENLYNRQFILPNDNAYPLEARFSYLDWWQPYFDLNCDGQVCQADTASVFFMVLPLSMKKYQFAYDLSYPVMVEIRDPDAFNGEGYAFTFMLEQNLRNSDTFLAETAPLASLGTDRPPNNFCDPQQRSGNATIRARDAVTGRPINGAFITYACGDNHCSIGQTENGHYTGAFPHCIGGTLRVTKPDYASFTAPFDVMGAEQREANITLEPITNLTATIKNYELLKTSKRGQWQYQEAGGALRPPLQQSTLVQLKRNATPYQDAHFTAVELTGRTPEQLQLVPGTYEVTITSFLKDDITIPTDTRCFKTGFFVFKTEKCYTIPEDPLVFNETNPFPTGTTTFTYDITPEMIRGATSIEFKQFALAIQKVQEENRVMEDLNEYNKVQLYSIAQRDQLTPVIA